MIELFDKDYLDRICAMQKPTVFVDGHTRVSLEPICRTYVKTTPITGESVR